VLEAFLGGLPEGHESQHAHTKVAQLLTSLPSGVKAVEYIGKLAPQFPPLLHTPARDRVLVQKLLALVVNRLCQRFPSLTRDLLLFPLLFRPFLLSSSGKEGGGGGGGGGRGGG